MLLHLARVSVITIALALVGGVAYLLARPAPPTVITVVVPTTPAVAAAPATATTTVVQPAYLYPSYHPYWWNGWHHPTYHACGARVCWH